MLAVGGRDLASAFSIYEGMARLNVGKPRISVLHESYFNPEDYPSNSWVEGLRSIDSTTSTTTILLSHSSASFNCELLHPFALIC